MLSPNGIELRDLSTVPDTVTDTLCQLRQIQAILEELGRRKFDHVREWRGGAWISVQFCACALRHTNRESVKKGSHTAKRCQSNR